MPKSRGLLLLVIAPSGGGKGSIIKELMARNDGIKFSISATTRAPRDGEEDGVQYHFIDKQRFLTMVEKGEMLEYAEYCGNYYGTPAAPVEKWRDMGNDVILEIEVKGGLQIKQSVEDCSSVFILPPSMEVLEQRLRRRGTETEEEILGRLKTARVEIESAREFEYIVINDRLEDAVLDMEAIMRAEKCKTEKQYRLIERML